MLARVGPWYRPYKPPGFWHQGNACVYCGWLADSIDHAPPVTWAFSLGSEYFYKRKIELVKVPACRECNIELASKKLFTVKERTVYLAERYRHKYVSLLYGRPWSARELDELTGNLKRDLTTWAQLQHVIHRRIALIEENASLR